MASAIEDLVDLIPTLASVKRRCKKMPSLKIKAHNTRILPLAKKLVLVVTLLLAPACTSSTESIKSISDGSVKIEPDKGFGWLTEWAWSPDGRHIATAGLHNTITVWNATSGQRTLEISKHLDIKGAIISDIAWSPDGRRIASVCRDEGLQIWDTVSGQKLNSWHGPSDLRQVAWSPDGDRIACGGHPGEIFVLDAENVHLGIQPLKRLRFHEYGLLELAWSPNGVNLASSGAGQNICIWNVETAQILFELAGHGHIPDRPFSKQWPHVDFLEWNRDGNLLASWGNDWTIRIWEASSGKPIRVFRGHNNGGSSLDWHPSGKYIASATYERISRFFNKPDLRPVCRIWDPTSGKQLCELDGYMALWSPDGKRIALAGQDETIRIFEWLAK